MSRKQDFLRTVLLTLYLSALGVPLTAPRSPLTAQQTPHSSALDRLRDSLAQLSNVATLSADFERLRRADPLRAGWVALRLGELQADPDFSQARSTFRKASSNRALSAAARYGMGLAEEGRSRAEMRDPLRLGSRVGLGALERGHDSYLRALRADPRLVPAGIKLAEVGLALMDTSRLRESQAALRRAIALGPAPSDLLLSWGRVERAAGSLTSSAVAFERYLASGGDRALGLLELARTRLAMGQRQGEAPYYEGAALDQPLAISGYRSDLELIAPDSSLAEFDRVHGPARAAFLHRFWTDRDHLELQPEGARLQEHYRRLAYARRNFPLTISRRFYGRYDAYRSGNMELDDRGIIYVRQGEPTVRLRPFIFRAMPNESWSYHRAEGDLLFHFSAGHDENDGGDLYDYRLVESVFDLRGAADAPPDQLLLSRQSLSPLYSRMLNWGRFGAANARDQERNIGIASIAVGTTTDNNELHFRRRLRAVADLIAVGHQGESPLAHFVFGIPAADATGREVSGGLDYPVRVRLVALDRHDRAVARLDTSLVVQVDHRLSKKEYVVGRAELSLPPGRWTYRAALQQGDSAGVVLPRGTVVVGYRDEQVLSLSDIALGSPKRAVSWVTEAGDTVLLAPSGLFRERSEVQIYYEATGVHGGVYRHDIAVFRPGQSEEGRPPLVSVSFEEHADGPVLRSRRSLRLDRLKRGQYLVEVRLTGPDGQTQVRRRLLQLIGR